MKKVTIIGSGLTGPLLSILLAKHFKISSTLYERNKDCRLHNKFSGRSINLALSQRGINALQNADIFDKSFNKLLIPMYGRMIHDINGVQKLQPYSNKKEDCINSVSRAEINKVLLNKAEETRRVKITFSSDCLAARAELIGLGRVRRPRKNVISSPRRHKYYCRSSLRAWDNQ